VDLNLDTLKRDILSYLEGAGFAIFRGSPGGLDGLPVVLWDSGNYPDYQMFLDAAQKCGCKLIVFASREFEASDTAELAEQIEDCDFTREEQREYQKRLRDLRGHEGVTCSIELGFDYNSRLYVYQAHPDWYEEYMALEDEIGVRYSGDDEADDDDDSLGGYFSKN
jgi:hypothetical protein